MDSKHVYVKCSPSFPEYQTRSIYQYDHGLKLIIDGLSDNELYAVSKIHYTADGIPKSLNGAVEISEKTIVSDIPSVLSFQENAIVCYVYIETPEYGATVKKIMIPIIKRPMPSETEYTEDERKEFDALMAQLNVLKQNISALSDEIKQAQKDADFSSKSAAQSEANAGRYAELAEQAASKAGWMVIEPGDDGHLYMVKSDNVENITMEDDGNGRLVVVYGDEN